MVKRWLAYLRRHSDEAWQRYDNEDWQTHDPSKPFKEFYAKNVEAKLRQGRPHRSLGGNLFGRKYGKAGEGLFRRLVNLGLKPDDTCVDYGCGTLRLGIHAINYLNPRCYWGLDISDFLLQEGRKLIGDRLWVEKQPNLHVISADSVAEVAATRPAMLFSIKVLIHVHPDELPEYLHNIMRIIGVSGQAIIASKWSDKETIRYSELSWAHAISVVQDLVKANGGKTEIISEEACRLDHVGLTTKSGLLRIINSGGPARL
jgi:hypothetical protein